MDVTEIRKKTESRSFAAILFINTNLVNPSDILSEAADYLYGMETIRTDYLGELRTSALHLASGNTIITDAPVDNQGKGEAFSPTDLLAASLGSCMATIMGIAGRTHGIPLEGMQLKITKVMAAAPRRVATIRVDFDMPKHPFSEKEKNILEQAARACPVALSLHPDLKQEVIFNYQ
ncbi:MAG: hypothetical protein RL021_2246 [Bacteroidota bacterium]